jgi:hypothetical protein
MKKMCIACGMPMDTPEEHAMKDESKDYCTYCARSDGSMQSYDEKLDLLSMFLVKTQGLDETAARDTARNMMAKLPAWRNRLGM